MAITYSTNLRLTLIGTGDQAGTWGNTTNTNLGTLIEQAIAGFVSQTVSDSAGSPTSLTISDGTSSVARNMIIALDGALSAPRDVIFPTNKKLYFIHNNTTGGHAVTVKCAGQTGVAVPAGAKALLACNGTDIIDAANYFSTFIFPSSATITTLTGTTLGYSSASITTASIGSGTVSNLLATTISAGSASITNLSSGSGTISNLIATNAGFGSASITTVTGTTIGTVASSTIQGASGVITQFNAASATITTLTATSSTITTLKSSSATIDNLTVGSLNASITLPSSATIATLSGTTLGYGSASITNLSSVSGTVSGNFNMATASGNVGIGTSSPVSKLDVAGIVTIKDNPAATAGTTIESTNSGDTIFKQYYAGIMAFGTNNAEDMRLSSRNLLMTGGGDVRASIFYDYANTAYYLDPANTGTSMAVAGSITAGQTAALYKLDVLSSDFIVSRFQSTYTVGVKNYTAVLIGGQSTAAGASVGWVQDAVTPANSFFHVTPYASSEGGVFCITEAKNVGIGTSSPGAKLHLYGVTGAVANSYIENGDVIVGGKIGGQYFYSRGTANNWFSGIDSYVPSGSGGVDVTDLRFYTTNITVGERMRLDSAGNLGVGVTPSAWVGSWKALQIGASGALASRTDIFGTILGQNWFINTSGNDAYIGTGTATAYRQCEGQHQWLTAPSGTAGDAISFTQAMTLDASGRLLVGSTSGTSTLQITGAAANTGGTSSSAFSGTGAFINASAGAAAAGAFGSSVVFAQSWTSGAPSSVVATGQITGVKTAPDGSFGGGLAFWTSNGGGNDLAERARIDSAGNVGIGTTSPTQKLDVAGSILASGNVTAYSDIRVKDNVESITDAIEKLSQIRGVTYTRTDLEDKERKYAGVIAQEIEQVLPEAVFDNGKVKAVDYNATIALLIEAVKQQQGQINELKLTIEQLKGN